jgi:transposase
MTPNRRRVDVNLDELDRVLDGAREVPLSEADCEKVKTALHALAAMLVRPRNTEKTNAVLPKSEDPGTDVGPPPDESSAPPAKGHGRNGAEAFSGARKVEIQHQNLKHGDRCPDCGQGNVYGQKEPKVLVRVVGQAPLAATVYSLERLRCGACGQVFTAQEPEGVGPEKYDETATAMVAQLKYGCGVPFNRLEQLEAHLGIPLPATTQWEMVEEGAELIEPARDELIRQAAQDEVFHHDDTGMKVLKMNREPDDKRTGTFTSGIVSTKGQRKIALYFTGRQHAGENLADVLRQRASELGPPIQMCDALSWNTSKLSEGVEVMIAHCLAHGRRQIVEIAENFPAECRYVLEQLGEVYRIDAIARNTGLSPQERLRFHQEHSKPIMDGLHKWLEAQLAEHQTEPNSGLGQAIRYLLRHWQPLTLFLRQAGAPLDNNLCTAARGSGDVMPTVGLCRVDGFPNPPARFLMVADAA